MKKSELITLIREEVESLVDSIDHVSINKKLSSLRETVLKNKDVMTGGVDVQTGVQRFYTTLSLETVSKLIEVPINELMLYFLNGQRNLNENKFLVEMKMHVVYFYKN